MQTVEYREPEFDDEQRAWLLAFMRLEADTGQYGESLTEATSERADPNYYGSGKILYAANGPFTNYAIKAHMDAKQSWMKQAGDDANTNGMYWTVARTDY